MMDDIHDALKDKTVYMELCNCEETVLVTRLQHSRELYE